MFWSDLKMQDGEAPGPGDVVTVTSDMRLIQDVSAEVEGLIVMGEFFSEDKGVNTEPLTLTLGWSVVMGGGSFNVGWDESPYQGELTVTLSGDDPQQDIALSDYISSNMRIENQDAFLMVMGEGSTLSIIADDAAKRSWTQINRTASVGDTTLSLAEATGWEVGDDIAIASTDFDLNQAEQRTIREISDDGLTLTLNSPLDFMHFGEVETHSNSARSWDLDMRAEVGLLSRDVTLQGPPEAATTLYGGHTMIMNGAEMYISGVEFTRMGQAGLIGKYAAHWHENGNSEGQYIRNSSFHRTYNKGLTIHNTANTEVTDNVTYETIGHSYYLEDGDETGNILVGNLGINTRGAASEAVAAVDSDFSEPTTFWIKNPDNTFIDNHAAGSEDKGFWTDARGDSIGLTAFIGNTAHSTDGRGFYLNHGGKIQDGDPIATAERPQEVAPWEVVRFTTYKSDGVYVRGVEGEFVDSVFAEMRSNARFRLNQTIRDSLIIGRSTNTGTPLTSEELAAGRSLPGGDDGFQGFQLYDGPGSLVDVHFDGFISGDEAIGLSNAVHKSASFAVKGITWGDNVIHNAKLKINGGNNAIGTDSWARAIIDVDGSVTGSAGAMIYQKSSDRDGSTEFNAGSNFEIDEAWDAVITRGQQSATLRIDDRGTDALNDGASVGNPLEEVVMTRSDGLTAGGISDQIPLFDGYDYELDYRSSDSDLLRLYLHDADWGQSFMLNLGPVPTDSAFTLDDPYTSAARAVREVSSLAMLEASATTAIYRDTASDDVHIKLVAEMARGYLWPQPGATYNDALHSGVTVLIDTRANLNLASRTIEDPIGSERLGSEPDTNGRTPVTFTLGLTPSGNSGSFTDITNSTMLSAADLASGDYALDVTANQSIALLRVSASGMGTQLLEGSSGTAFSDGITISRDKFYISVQAFSDTDADDEDLVGNQVFEFDLR
ncbi:MAG: G8 domain-containing protein [Pseudomonadota bacterium]